MKKLFSNKVSIFIAIIVLFIFGQILGTFVIKAFFINYKIDELSPQLSYISDEIAKGSFTFSRKTDFILKAYDVYASDIDIFSDEVPSGHEVSNQSISKTLISYIPRVIAGKEVATLQKISGQTVESIIIGKPIIKDGNVYGAVFLLKPASDFSAVLNGFYLVFFVTLLVGTLFIGLFLYLYIRETKQLEQTRRDYIANISHELKSPIASVKALTETLTDNVVQDEETKEKYYAIILSEIKRLQKLISDMLELSRLQSGKIAFSKEKINTGELMMEIYNKYNIILDDMDIEFEVTDIAFNSPNIYSNRDRIVQVLNILIDNAIKFVGENGKITIDVEVNRSNLKIKVIDNGIGIEKNVVPYIFDRFYKEDKAHNKSGSGLGLSIAKEIITGLGEELMVNSEYGKGTMFYFTVKRSSFSSHTV